MKNRVVLILVFVLFSAVVGACALGEDGAKGPQPEDENGLENSGAFGYTWRRVGGIAGFCDIVELSAEGIGIVRSCATEPPRLVGEVPLTADMTAKLTALIEEFTSFTYEESDPAVADAMTIVIEFKGRGDRRPSAADYEVMQTLAIEVMRLVGGP